MPFRRVSLCSVDGDDATWAGMTMFCLSKQPQLLQRDPDWAPRLVRVAKALLSGKTVRVAPQPVFARFLYPGEELSEDDALSAVMALVLLSNHFRDHEPQWADQLRRVAQAVRKGSVVRLRPPGRQFSSSNADDVRRAKSLSALVNKCDIIGGPGVA